MMSSNCRVFKYRLIGYWDGNEIKPYLFTEKMFVNRELWFSHPKNLNDPFDCNLSLHVKGTNQEVADYLNTMREKTGSPQNAVYQVPEHLDPQKEWVDDGTIDFQRAFDDRYDKIYNRSSCYCWSTNGESIPMFAYYADGHKGLCAEFEFPDDHEAIKDAFRIECRPQFPELNFLKLVNDTTGQLVKSLIATKASCWEHEEEWRVFRDEIPEGNVKYEDSCLKRVILGAKTSQEHEQMVRSWLSNWKTEIILARAKPSKTEFKLIIEDFDSIGKK